MEEQASSARMGPRLEAMIHVVISTTAKKAFGQRLQTPGMISNPVGFEQMCLTAIEPGDSKPIFKCLRIEIFRNRKYVFRLTL